jgi:hypothetical protein
MKTAYLFYKIINDSDDRLQDWHPAIEFDFFGISYDNKNFEIMYGIYSGLIKFKGVSRELLYNCYITNRLDELIHKKYTNHKSKYYVDFVKKNIVIGDTYYSVGDESESESEEDELEKIEITTDDFCPTCGSVGYYTNKNYVEPLDCFFGCGNIICKKCKNDKDIKENDVKMKVFSCYDCEYKLDNKNIQSTIARKIREYKRTDLVKFGTEGNVESNDVVELLNKQKFKCYVCNDDVKTFMWRPFCLYQFTLDRLDNSLPHNRDNVLICCYYCNCIDFFSVSGCSENVKNKICNKGCHCVKRNISVKRTDVSKEKIDSLKLSAK